MEISELTLKLIIVLAPGAIASIIFEKLTIHQKWTSFKFVYNSILFAGVSYLLMGMTNICFLRNDTLNDFWRNLPTKEVPLLAVKRAACISIVLGFLGAAFDHHKIINRLGRWIKVSSKYGDENLFYYFLNSKEVNEVYVRDYDQQLTYQGMLESFSETSEIKEIVLRDVKVFEYDSNKEIDTLDKIYITRSKDSLIIEVPFKT